MSDKPTVTIIIQPSRQTKPKVIDVADLKNKMEELKRVYTLRAVVK